MTYRNLYDSVTVADIPKGAVMVAGYVDGSYRNIEKIRQGWPHAIHVSITVTGRDITAQVVDCERGDTTPTTAALWAKKKIDAKAGHPTIYCSLSAWPSVKAAVAAAGLKPGEVSYWIAEYGAVPSRGSAPVVPAGAVAKQYRSTTKPNLDYSVVVDYWPGVDAPPKVTAPPVKKVAPSTRPKAVAQPAPKHPAPRPGPSSRAAARARLLAAIKAKLHRLHLLHLKNRPRR